MKDHSNRRSDRRAFSLIELAMVIAVSGLMVGFLLQANVESGSMECYTSTKQQLATIRGSIEQFARKNDRLPRPAARNVGVENITYGRENSGANIDTAAGVYFGALPFQTLGLPPTYASDCWGNKFSYMVTATLTTNATLNGYLDYNVNGNITLKSSMGANINTNTGFVVISHGEDGIGAVKANYSAANAGGSPDTAHRWCSGAATLNKLNCLATAATAADGVFNNGANAGANYFDDVVAAGGRPQILNNTNLYCWGTDVAGTGILGDNSSAANHFKYTPTRARSNVQFVKLSKGSSQDRTPCGLTADGTAYCWGDNSNGNVGDGTTTNRAMPTAVNTTVKFKEIYQTATGTTHCGIALDDTAWCWGWSGYTNIVGAPSNSSITTPRQVSPTYKFSKIMAAAGGHGMCGLELNKRVYCWSSGAVSLSSGPDRLFSDVEGNGPMCGITDATDPVGAGKIYCWRSMGGTLNIGGLGVIPLDITNISNAAIGEVTYTPGTYSLGAGDAVYIVNVDGMGEINYQLSYVRAGQFTANTFKLFWDDHPARSINTTSYGTYTGGGQLILASRTDPVLIDNTAGLNFVRFGANANSAITDTGQIYSWGSNSAYRFANGSGGGWPGKTANTTTNATPAVVTTTTAHGYVTGDRILRVSGGGTVALAVQDGSAGTITLNAADAAADNAYVGQTLVITSGTGAGQIRTLGTHSSATKVANVYVPWVTPPNATSNYIIGAPLTAQATSTSAAIVLNASASAVDDIYAGQTIYLTGGTGSGQTRTITAYNGATKAATVSVAFGTVPNATTAYVIGGVPVAAQGSGTAQTVTLNAGAPASDGYYIGETINIAAGQGSSQSKTITAYDGTTKKAVVDTNWTTAPNSASTYTIGGSIYGFYHVGATPTATSFELLTQSNTPVNTSKWTVIGATSYVKMPLDGSCIAWAGYGTDTCSYTVVPATQNYMGTPYTVSEYVGGNPNIAKTSMGWMVNGGGYPTNGLGNSAITTSTTLIPMTVGGLNLLSPIYHGYVTVYMFDDQGDLYSFGSNPSGNLGDGTNVNRRTPTLVTGGYKFKDVMTPGNGGLSNAATCAITDPLY